jgi:predicted PurR-regulated permease PerM
VRAVSQSDLVRAALVVVAALVGLQLLWSARFLVLTAFLGVLFGLAASGAVDRIIKRIPLRRPVVAAIVVFGSVGLLGLIGAWTGPTLAEQSQELRTKLPEAVTKVEAWLALKQPAVLDMIAPPDSLMLLARADSVANGYQRDTAVVTDSLADPPGRLVGAVARYSAAITTLAFGVVQSTLAVVAALFLVIFLAVYIAADPEVYRRGVLALVPPARRARVSHLLHLLGRTLRTWFATQLIAMFVIGSVTTIALAIIGVRAALPLGVLAGLFEFIPNVGPLLSALPAIMVGFADSPRMALIVVGVYWAIQFLENNLLIPYLMKEQLDLPPALTLVTQVVMAYVFGFLGLFVAIPLLASVVVTVRTFWVEEEPIPEAPVVEGPAGGAPLIPPVPAGPAESPETTASPAAAAKST